MTEGIAISIISGIFSVAAAWFAHRAHKAVNSRMDEFKRIAEKLFHAEGVAQGQQEERERQKTI